MKQIPFPMKLRTIKLQTNECEAHDGKAKDGGPVGTRWIWQEQEERLQL